MKNKIKWGIMATGDIAKKFAAGLKVNPGAQLLAVGSRSRKAADKFGDKFGVPRRYPTYQALAHDPDLDVVYIATPNSLHKENSIMCLKAGKAVLCEKPFTINAQEAEQVIQTARTEKKFLMEAMWMRFLPAMRQVQAWIDQGEIGRVRMVQAGFGYCGGVGTVYDPALGGGSLLDVGVYPITLADVAFKKPPDKIASFAHIARGIDEQAAIIFHYRGGGMAMMSTAVMTNTPKDAFIMGDKGMIKIHEPFWRTERLTLVRDGKKDKVLPVKLKQHLRYHYEAEAVMESIRKGELQNQLMPWDKTMEIMRILDQIRGQWGFKYPVEIEGNR